MGSLKTFHHWPTSSLSRRTLVELTEQGRLTLEADRRQREGWLARAIAEDLSQAEQRVLIQALGLLRRLSGD